MSGVSSTVFAADVFFAITHKDNKNFPWNQIPWGAGRFFHNPAVFYYL